MFRAGTNVTTKRKRIGKSTRMTAAIGPHGPTCRSVNLLVMVMFCQGHVQPNCWDSTDQTLNRFQHNGRSAISVKRSECDVGEDAVFDRCAVGEASRRSGGRTPPCSAPPHWSIPSFKLSLSFYNNSTNWLQSSFSEDRPRRIRPQAIDEP
jgi:hypothetical protein